MASLSEWWYNTNYHSSFKLTPFEALYGYSPTSIPFLEEITTSVQAVTDVPIYRQKMLTILKENLQQAQNRIKQQADKMWTEEYQVGDWVYLRSRR